MFEDDVALQICAYVFIAFMVVALLVLFAAGLDAHLSSGRRAGAVQDDIEAVVPETASKNVTLETSEPITFFYSGVCRDMSLDAGYDRQYLAPENATAGDGCRDLGLYDAKDGLENMDRNVCSSTPLGVTTSRPLPIEAIAAQRPLEVEAASAPTPLQVESFATPSSKAVAQTPVALAQRPRPTPLTMEPQSLLPISGQPEDQIGSVFFACCTVKRTPSNAF